MMYCQYCGKQIDDDSIFCIHCGKHQLDDGVRGSSQFVADEEEYAGKRKSGTSLGVKIGIAVAAVAIIGAIVAAVIVFALPNPDDSSNDVTTQEVSDVSDDVSKEDTVAALKDAKEGDLVALGQYEQGSGSDAESIDWIVLGVEDGHALLLSDKVIDCKQVASSISSNFDVTWEKSDIREWLNGDFLKSFTEAELDAIDTAKLEQSHDGATQDKVFLMDSSEFSAYVPEDLAGALATDYAAEHGLLTYSGTQAANWWLRDYNPRADTLSDDNNFLYVDYDGNINKSGFLATDDYVGVRPAMWVSLDGKGVSEMETQAKSSSQDSTVTGTTDTGSEDGNETGGTSDDEYVLPDSSTRKYSEAELASLSDWELSIARNEIYARYGRGFKKKELADYFAGMSWYEELYTPEQFDAMPDPLNPIERSNALLIKSIEQKRGSENS